MALLNGYRGLVFGVANERSIAWHVARHLMAEGAVCGFAHLPDGPPGGLGPLPPSPDLGIAWFETITFRPLGHGWYAWSAVQ